MKPKIQRHEHILTLVREHNFMTVEELAAKFGCDAANHTPRCAGIERNRTAQTLSRRRVFGRRFSRNGRAGAAQPSAAGKKRHCPT